MQFHGMREKTLAEPTFPCWFISFTELYFIGSATPSGHSPASAPLHIAESCLVSSWWPFLRQESAAPIWWLWVASQCQCHLLRPSRAITLSVISSGVNRPCDIQEVKERTRGQITRSPSTPHHTMLNAPLLLWILTVCR